MTLGLRCHSLPARKSLPWTIRFSCHGESMGEVNWKSWADLKARSRAGSTRVEKRSGRLSNSSAAAMSPHASTTGTDAMAPRMARRSNGRTRKPIIWRNILQGWGYATADRVGLRVRAGRLTDGCGAPSLPFEGEFQGFLQAGENGTFAGFDGTRQQFAAMAADGTEIEVFAAGPAQMVHTSIAEDALAVGALLHGRGGRMVQACIGAVGQLSRG